MNGPSDPSLKAAAGGGSLHTTVDDDSPFEKKAPVIAPPPNVKRLPKKIARMATYVPKHMRAPLPQGG